jgi:lipid II:glycine glycyltransferase (peptidoglycan interpeptide bridge formation enzyme)
VNSKYNLFKLKDLKNWDNFEKISPQSSIFSSVEAIEFFKQNLDLYSIQKGEELKALVYVYLNKEKVVPEPLIYSGILFYPKKNQKNCRYLAEKFSITEEVINKIFINYKNLELNLHYNFEDLRPFQWFNYHEPDKPKYKIDIRYTSLINLIDKKKNQVFDNLDDVKQRDIKKCELNSKISFNYNDNLDLIKKFYIATMQKNNGEFSNSELDKMLNFMDILIQKKKGFQTNVLLDNKVIYSTFLSIHNKTACYLYGAGDVNIKDRLSGTYCLWKSLEKCLSENVDLLDLEGINSPNRGSFKLSFGGKIENYYTLKIKN